jgi:hypothetical protein
MGFPALAHRYTDWATLALNIKSVVQRNINQLAYGNKERKKIRVIHFISLLLWMSSEFHHILDEVNDIHMGDNAPWTKSNMDARKLMSWVGRVKRFQWRLVGLTVTFLKNSVVSFAMKRRMQILDLRHVTLPFSQAHACTHARTDTHSEDTIYGFNRMKRKLCM